MTAFKPIITFTFFLILSSFHFIQYVSSNGLTSSADSWHGNWFPFSPNEGEDNNPDVTLYMKNNLYDPQHGVAMGVINSECDDGKTRLDIDWDLNPVNYTCVENKYRYSPRTDVQPLYRSDYIPKSYSAVHMCMNRKIDYDDTIPTYGPHRPLWAQYGEYVFLPKQRWVHNLEHGAIVMLYHPCADKNEIYLLRKLIRTCLYRYIITPYNLLSPERPLALVAWGHRLEMSKVDPHTVFNFIKHKALHGPEELANDGQYNFLLKSHADLVSDINDSNLCKVFQIIE